MKKVIASALLLAISFSALAGNAQSGQQKAASCQGCHGAAGKAAVSLYPNLAGQNADYLAHSLHAYQKGERSGGQAEVMKAFVAGLSDEDMADLAAYYAGLKP
ncbi:cytochrome c [Erwinia sp. BC051422]|uniref:c-type cytochrome n=1 Tax=Erwinia wuhanensis TaxID=3045167 RepID=UPI002656F331|nr:cytochrome c [Erwinia sp. BC051422]MDN8541878.1 cytochrome c [Erwinia sp. BC051422]